MITYTMNINNGNNNFYSIRSNLEDFLAQKDTLDHEARMNRITELRLQVLGSDHAKLRFPEKLHRLVSCKDLSPDVYWLRDGITFAVDKAGYQLHLMNIFFRQHKYKSFQNMLSRYKFTAVSPGKTMSFPQDQTKDVFVYKHRYFRKDREDLSRCIVPTSACNKKRNGEGQGQCLTRQYNRRNNSNTEDVNLNQILDKIVWTGNAPYSMSVPNQTLHNMGITNTTEKDINYIIQCLDPPRFRTETKIKTFDDKNHNSAECSSISSISSITGSYQL